VVTGQDPSVGLGGYTQGERELTSHPNIPNADLSLRGRSWPTRSYLWSRIQPGPANDDRHCDRRGPCGE
jgi:hypothetical protein